MAQYLYNASLRVLDLGYVDSSFRKDLADHIVKFRPCLDEINVVTTTQRIDNLNTVTTHALNISTTASENARLELIRLPAPNHFPSNCHPDFTDTLDSTLQLANLESWDKTLSKLSTHEIFNDIVDNVQDVKNNLILSKLNYDAGLNIDSNTVEYSRVVRRVADTFGTDGAGDAFRLYEMAHNISEIFLFTCLEHKFVLVLGIGTFSRWVYEWCIHHDGFKTLMKSVAQDVHARFVPLRAKISRVLYSLRWPLASGGAGVLSYYCLPLFQKLNNALWIRNNPMLQVIKDNVYDISYSIGALFKAARVGFCDGAFEDILRYLERVLAKFWSKK